MKEKLNDDDDSIVSSFAFLMASVPYFFSQLS